MRWITYLGDKAGHDADRLILETVGLLNDVSLEVRYTKEYAAVPPGLYWNILKNWKDMTPNDMVSIGYRSDEDDTKEIRYAQQSSIENG